MTRKTAIKILVGVMVIAISVVLYFSFFSNNKTEEGGEFALPDQPSSNFFPDSEDFDPETNNNGGDNQNNNLDQFNIPTLRQISQNPTSGYVVFDRSASSTNTLENESVNETETVYRYVNRSNGNLLETTSKTKNVTRLTNNTIPKVYESFLSKDGKNIIFRYLDNNTIETKLGFLLDNNSTTTQVVGDESNFIELETSFLSRNINNLVINNNSVFYTIPSDFGLNGFVFNINNPNQQEFVFTSEMKQLIPEWLDENTILFGTKSSNNSNGYLFEYNINSGEFIKILDGGIGFNFLPKTNSNQILYSKLDGSKLNSYLFNKETLETKNINVNTIVADKCVWSELEENIVYCAEPTFTIGLGYPNVWYQGQIYLTDNLFKINTETGSKTQINIDGSFDITNIKLSTEEDFITFIDKKDLTLWSLDIK